MFKINKIEILLIKLYSKFPSIIKSIIYKIICSIEGGEMYSITIRKIYYYLHKLKIGYGTYGGCFNRNNNIPPDISFGNYCSISSNIRIFRANHPYKEFTTHPILFNPIAGNVKKDLLKRPELVVGHDVWIGEWVIITPGVNKIGNGAVIGSGSIVTKDIPPYSIAVGNPAKVIGYRFDETTINNLEKSKWWNFKKDELIMKLEQIQSLI
jgi:acetyltransferase-like isoleucine patch superfamily enzyme